jgi:hypothetical protein
VSIKPKYILIAANAHNYVFRDVSADSVFGNVQYLVPRYVWARWSRGDYP